MKLQTSVNMASWTHNTNVNVLGYLPLQLVTGKSIVLPGLNNGNVVTESEYDDKAVRKIMETHNGMMKEFRELDFSKKLKKASKVQLIYKTTGTYSGEFQKKLRTFTHQKYLRTKGYFVMALSPCFENMIDGSKGSAAIGHG